MRGCRVRAKVCILSPWQPSPHCYEPRGLTGQNLLLSCCGWTDGRTDGWWMDGELRMRNVLHTQTAEWKHVSERDRLRQEYTCVCVDKNLYTLRSGNIRDEMSWKQRSQGPSHVWILNPRTCGGLCVKALLTHLFRPWFNKALSKLSDRRCVLWALDKSLADPGSGIGRGQVSRWGPEDPCGGSLTFSAPGSLA